MGGVRAFIVIGLILGMFAEQTTSFKHCHSACYYGRDYHKDQRSFCLCIAMFEISSKFDTNNYNFCNMGCVLNTCACISTKLTHVNFFLFLSLVLSLFLFLALFSLLDRFLLLFLCHNCQRSRKSRKSRSSWIIVHGIVQMHNCLCKSIRRLSYDIKWYVVWIES